MNRTMLNAMLRELVEIKLAALAPNIISSVPGVAQAALGAARKGAKPLVDVAKRGPKLDPSAYSSIRDAGPASGVFRRAQRVGASHPAVGGGGGSVDWGQFAQTG
jgi:hypothetical protein